MLESRKPVGPQQKANATGIAQHVHFITDEDGNRVQTTYGPADVMAKRAAALPLGLHANHVATYEPQRDGNRYR